MDWYMVTLSHDDISAGRHFALQNAFTEIFIKLGGPKDAGMFQNPGIGIHEYYFSPGAARIAMPMIVAWHGKKCSALKKSQLHQLVSSDDSSEVAFAPEF